MRVSIEEVEQAIAQFPHEEQRRLLAELPGLLKFSPADFAYLKLAESSFHFWENPDDAIYDTL
jgi:hypothetical protein